MFVSFKDRTRMFPVLPPPTIESSWIERIVWRKQPLWPGSKSLDPCHRLGQRTPICVLITMSILSISTMVRVGERRSWAKRIRSTAAHHRDWGIWMVCRLHRCLTVHCQLPSVPTSIRTIVAITTSICMCLLINNTSIIINCRRRPMLYFFMIYGWKQFMDNTTSKYTAVSRVKPTEGTASYWID